jgi:Fe-S cluster assembly protein SufD
MTQIETEKDTFLGGLREAAKLLSAPLHKAQDRQRREADRLLTSQRLPTLKDEAWRFTPLASLTQQTFSLVDRLTAPPNVLLADIGRFLLPEAETTRLVFVNGVYVPHLSCVKDLAPGLVVAPLSQVGTEVGDVLDAHLGTLVLPDGDVFSTLNTRCWDEGALVVIPAGAHIKGPVQLMFVASDSGTPHLSSPRCLVVVGKDSEATIVEEYVCLQESVYFTNAVAEIVMGENARLRHCRVQSESRAGFHIARTSVSLGRDAKYCSQAVTLGARLSRYNLDVLQTDTGTEARIDGLALIAGHQEADTHTTLDHAKPHGRSEQMHKCIVDDEAHAVFNGRVLVRKDAQQTDSSQASRNLLLSDRARIDTKPELEIFADDVKCAHGAAVGQIDADELFYLRSRGLDEGNARDLLTYAFAAEVIDRVPVPSLRRQLQAVVLKQTDKHTTRLVSAEAGA